MTAARIGIDVTSALTQGGGIGRYTRELVRALAACESENQYTLFSARVPSSLPIPNPLPVGPAVKHRSAFVDERWLYRLWYRLRIPLSVQLFSGPLDLFHSPDFVLPPVSGHIPTLLTVHDLSFIHFPETFPTSLVNYLNKVVPWSVARATHILADSQSTKNDLMDYWSVPDGKITVLYSGVSDDYQPVEDTAVLAAVRQTYGLGEKPYLLSVGTVQPRKNYKMLIQAFAEIAADNPHELAIAGGKGWMASEMMEEADRQGIAGRVHFLGFVDDDHLPALYSAATLFVFPSLYEGFGLPVLEAMACGVPTIISNNSSLPEVGGDAALQLPPDSPTLWSQAMNMLLNDGSRTAALIEAGYAQAQRFSWERAANELLDLYGSFLDKARTSRHN